MLRLLTKSRRVDRVRITDMLEETRMLSVNQTEAQIKLLEMWKVEDYPIKMDQGRPTPGDRSTRSGQTTKYKEFGRTRIGKKSFVGDAP